MQLYGAACKMPTDIVIFLCIEIIPADSKIVTLDFSELCRILLNFMN